MIEIRRVENRLMVSTIELYDLLKNDRKKYYNWIHHKILLNQILKKPTDYFIHRKHSSRNPTEIYVTILIAQHLCLSERTNVARRVLEAIDKNVEIIRSTKVRKKIIAEHLE